MQNKKPGAWLARGREDEWSATYSACKPLRETGVPYAKTKTTADVASKGRTRKTLSSEFIEPFSIRLCNRSAGQSLLGGFDQKPGAIATSCDCVNAT